MVGLSFVSKAIILIVCCCTLCVQCYTGDIVSEELINLYLPRPYGIYVVTRYHPLSNSTVRIGFLDHNIILLRPEWRPVFPVRNVLANTECELIIFAAEEFASNHGWMTKRHDNYPTTDLPLKAIFPEKMANDIIGTLQSAIFPHYREYFHVDTSSFYIVDLFVAKYDGSENSSAQKELAPHRDNSPWSFVVSLNREYEGGGTYFTEPNEIFQVGTGHAVIFSGKNEHAGSMSGV